MPAFELIATIANADPGEGGLYNTRQPDSTIRRYLKLARENEALLLLDVQPGRGDFMTEVERLSPFLREPDVGLALDPEWHVGAIGVPGEEIGSVDAAEVNEVSGYLQGLVDRHGLPQKLLVVHQFTEEMIEAKEALVAPPDVAVVLNADGFGDQANKVAKYRALRPRGPIKRLPARLQALLPGGLRPDVPQRSARAAAPAGLRRLRVEATRRAQEPVRERLCLLATIGSCAPLTH